jgi:pilus assembly protein Flp/PilA
MAMRGAVARLPSTRRLFVRFARGESGVTAVEYALIASFMAVVIIVPLTVVGNQLAEVFNTIAAALSHTTP